MQQMDFADDILYGLFCSQLDAADDFSRRHFISIVLNGQFNSNKTVYIFRENAYKIISNM